MTNTNRTKIKYLDYSISTYARGWIEALIDGEGSLSLIKLTRPKFKAGYTYSARLNISNKCLALLVRAKKIIGAGSISNPRPDGLFNYNVSPNDIRRFLPKISLIAKAKQQILLLEALQIVKRHTTHNKSRTDSELKRLEEIRQEIIARNRGRLS